jgi:hypothetical protein
MTDQKTVQEQLREQFKVAETTAQKLFDTWSDLSVTTTEWSMNALEQTLRYNAELRSQNERALQETVATYRNMYQTGLRTWQDYVHSINGIVSRVTQN